MPKTLASWHEDHANFAKLLALLESQFALFHEGGSPSYELMLDIMYYMTHYSDVLHHPKEDLAFAKMKARDKTLTAKLDELVAQHAELRDLGNRLVRDLDAILDGSIVAREHIETSARDYVGQLRRHMTMEEKEILPAAAKLLRESEWAAIDAAIGTVKDPLFGSSAEERYAALREHIAKDARSAD